MTEQSAKRVICGTLVNAPLECPHGFHHSHRVLSFQSQKDVISVEVDLSKYWFIKHTIMNMAHVVQTVPLWYFPGVFPWCIQISTGSLLVNHFHQHYTVYMYRVAQQKDTETVFWDTFDKNTMKHIYVCLMMFNMY